MSFFKKHSCENPDIQPKEQPEVTDETERLEMQWEIEREFETAGIRIEQPRRFPDLLINFEVFDEKFRDCLKKCCTKILSYLRLPFVWDNFKSDYKKRQKWRESIQKKYGKAFPEKSTMLIENKFCRNKTQVPLWAIGRMREVLKELDDEQYGNLVKTIKMAEDEIRDIDKEYLHRDINEKKEGIEKMEEIMYNILKAISEFSKE